MKGAGFGIITAVAVLFVAGLYFSSQPAEPDEKLSCSSDSDCAPAGCCHADSAVNKNFAPDCRAIFCSAVCAPGTLDCGGGEIKCIKNKCEVVLK